MPSAKKNVKTKGSGATSSQPRAAASTKKISSKASVPAKDSVGKKDSVDKKAASVKAPAVKTVTASAQKASSTGAKTVSPAKNPSKTTSKATAPASAPMPKASTKQKAPEKTAVVDKGPPKSPSAKNPAPKTNLASSPTAKSTKAVTPAASSAKSVKKQDKPEAKAPEPKLATQKNKAPAPQAKGVDAAKKTAPSAVKPPAAAAATASAPKAATAPKIEPIAAPKATTPAAEHKAPPQLNQVTPSTNAAVNVAPVKSGPEIKAAPPVAKAKASGPKHGFKLNEYIVYPAHGVGQITGVEIQEVAGFSLELFVVSFLKDKMILKVPTSKVVSVGMRKLAETNIVEKALSTLSGRARIKRTMWSRRAQEYEAKINSGDLVTIAEVVRDLYRSDTQPEQSYSERQLYEAALDRMAREIAAVKKLIDAESLKLIESFLQKGPKRGPKTEVEADGDASNATDSEVDADTDNDDSDVDRAA